MVIRADPAAHAAGYYEGAVALRVSAGIFWFSSGYVANYDELNR